MKKKEKILQEYKNVLQKMNESGDLDSRLLRQLLNTGSRLLEEMYQEGQRNPLLPTMTPSQENMVFEKISNRHRLSDAGYYLQGYIRDNRIDPENIFGCEKGPKKMVSFRELVSEDSEWYALQEMADIFDAIASDQEADAVTWYEAARQALS